MQSGQKQLTVNSAVAASPRPGGRAHCRGMAWRPATPGGRPRSMPGAAPLLKRPTANWRMSPATEHLAAPVKASRGRPPRGRNVPSPKSFLFFPSPSRSPPIPHPPSPTGPPPIPHTPGPGAGAGPGKRPARDEDTSSARPGDRSLWPTPAPTEHLVVRPRYSPRSGCPRRVPSSLRVSPKHTPPGRPSR